MKKVLLSMLSIFVIVALVACGQKDGNGSDDTACAADATTTVETPKDVCIRCYELTKAGDFDAVTEMYCDKSGQPLSAQAKQEFKALLSMMGNGMASLSEYEILEENISEDGANATVKAKLTYSDNSTKEDKTKLIKDNDGKWQMVMGFGR